ncbi:Probable poly(beta-D-mannuronate) O-acetylase [hydrothermal vent metagenome]|uniref:Probable poly(Beta-D-mannuronate) O-acetylase n=1 Tax=hydrothermal vent metagenome TaxID=652676 RepID=A0A3B0ZRW4_9ZZZZ
MLFNSYEFIVLFLPISLIIFFVLGRYYSNHYAIFWLVATSLFFYGWWNPNYLILICLSIIINYIIGLLITRYNGLGSNNKPLFFVVLGVSFNLLLLGYFKYSNFFLNTINYTVGFDWNLHNVLLPIGISFFTFQQIAYLVDTKTNKTSEHNFLHYSLFVVFFPQLIAGPIVHHRQMLPQFTNRETYSPTFQNISVGSTIFIIGLFKKVVIADNIAVYVNPVFDMAETGQAINFFQTWTATLGYSLQLYFDFSGYSDMAIGLARLFGVKLPINFYSPYKATSIIDFWQRWHMTLSRFLRDYVYIPLGGNRKGPRRRYINLMLTMVIGGLWHGAAWTFVAWGALHGVFIIINHLWTKIALFPTNINRWWSVLMARMITFLLVSIAWILFRAESFVGVAEIYKGMFNLPISLLDKFGDSLLILNDIGFSFIDSDVGLLNGINFLFLVVAVIALWILPNTQELMSNYDPAYDYQEKNKMFNQFTFIKKLLWYPNVAWSLYISILFICSFLSLTQVSEFLYFQF